MRSLSFFSEWIEGSLLFGLDERSQVFLHLSVTIKKLMGCWKVTLLRRAKGWALGRQRGGSLSRNLALFYPSSGSPVCKCDSRSWLRALEVAKWGEDYDVALPAARRRQAQSVGPVGGIYEFRVEDFTSGGGKQVNSPSQSRANPTFRALRWKFVPPFELSRIGVQPGQRFGLGSGGSGRSVERELGWRTFTSWSQSVCQLVLLGHWPCFIRS